jgi:hypothetical protein
MGAKIDEPDWQLGPDLILHCVRNAASARLSKRLQPSRKIDSIAEQIVALYNDIPDTNADSEPHLVTRN